MAGYKKDLQFYKFCFYGFFKNLRFFDPFLILFFISKGLNYTEIGILYAIREIFINIFEIPSGLITDSFGRKRSMLLSFSFYIFSFLMFYFSNRFLPLAFSMILYAFGDAFRTGTHKAMIYEYLRIKGWEEYKVDYYGNTRACSQLGSALSSLIAGVIVFFTDSLKNVFLFSVIPYIIDFILILTYPSYLDKDIVKPKESIKERFNNVIKTLIISLKNPKAVKILINSTLYSAYYKALKDYIQIIIKTFALSFPFYALVFNRSLSEKEKIAIFSSLIYFVLYLLTSYASKNSKRLLKRLKSMHMVLNLTLIIGLILGIAVGLTYRFNMLVISLILFIMIYIIENYRRPVAVAYLNNVFSNNVFASAISIESQVKTILTSIFGVILGILSDKIGVWEAIIGLSILLIILFPFVSLKED